MHPLHIHRSMPRTLARAAVAAVALGLLAACSTEPDAPTAAVSQSDAHAAHARRASSAPTQGQLNAAERVREATAHFADLDAAIAAGYSAQFPAGCAVSPTPGEGAQGFHFLNESLVDHKTELLQPELVMYEPQADGSMVLVGVDYIIPFTEWRSPQPPVLLGEPFMRNDPLGVWALHIWVPRANPSGLFAAWNPTVSCEHADQYVP